MKYQHCGNKYSAAFAQPAPGGSSAPGHFFALAIILGVTTIGFFLAGFDWTKWIIFGITCFVVLVMFIAWSDCRGGTCPECGVRNIVLPWSFWTRNLRILQDTVLSKALLRLSLPDGNRHRIAPDPVAGRKNEKSALSALPFRHYLTIVISILYPLFVFKHYQIIISP